MRSSLVPMPPGSRLIVLRAPYLALCGGDTAPALLLDILVFYMDLRYQQETINDLWLPFTYQQFIDESLGLLKDHDVRRGLTFLRTSGLIHDRPGTVSHTLEYWVDVAMLRELLDIGEVAAGISNRLQVTDQSVTGNGSSVNSALTTTTRVIQPHGGSPEASSHKTFEKPPRGGRAEPTRVALDDLGEELAYRGPVVQSNLALKIARASGGKSLRQDLVNHLQKPFRWTSETTAALGDHIEIDMTPDELFDTPDHPCHQEFVGYLDRYIAKVKVAIKQNGKNKLAKPSQNNIVAYACSFTPFNRAPQGGANEPTPTHREDPAPAGIYDMPASFLRDSVDVS